MKQLIVTLVAVFTFALAQASYAQTAIGQAGAQAQSASNSQSGSAAQSNNSIVFPSPLAETTTKIENVPSVTAPSIIGGGHPCLSGQSGGISVLGGGLSAGSSQAEAICMLMVLGQQEAAIRALAASSPKACRALENVGYYIVPMGGGKTKAVSFRCRDRIVKGGIYTRSAEPIATRTVASTSTQGTVRPVTRSPTYSKCEMDGNKVRIRYETGADKAVAKKACLASLGY